MNVKNTSPNYRKTVLLAVVISFAAIMLFRFVIGPLFLTEFEHEVADRASDVGLYFIYYLFFVVLMIVTLEWVRSWQQKRKSSEQGAPPLPHARGGHSEGER